MYSFSLHLYVFFSFYLSRSSTFPLSITFHFPLIWSTSVTTVIPFPLSRPSLSLSWLPLRLCRFPSLVSTFLHSKPLPLPSIPFLHPFPLVVASVYPSLPSSSTFLLSVAFLSFSTSLSSHHFFDLISILFFPFFLLYIFSVAASLSSSFVSFHFSLLHCFILSSFSFLFAAFLLPLPFLASRLSPDSWRVLITFPVLNFDASWNAWAADGVSNRFSQRRAWGREEESRGAARAQPFFAPSFSHFPLWTSLAKNSIYEN